MKRPPLTVNIMTGSLQRGDAIGNYILTSAAIWRDWGAKVRIYADYIEPSLAPVAQLSRFYRPTGEAILWYHYSIYEDNLAIARDSQDYKVMDYHGISPPELFAGQDAHLQFLCQQGTDLLPELKADFDTYVVHSDYMRQELTDAGYAPANIYKIPLCIDTQRYAAGADNALADKLKKLDYCLFVGRIVPQKDIMALLDIFGRIHQHHPDMVLILVGSRHLAPNYQRRLDRAIRANKIEDRVMFVDQVNNPALLAALFEQARFLFVTSEWESFCVPLVEGMYFGTPSVIHAIPPLPEIAGEAGIVIDKREPEKAAESVLNLIRDDDHYNQMAQAAGERSANFTENSLRIALLNAMQQMFELSN